MNELKNKFENNQIFNYIIDKCKRIDKTNKFKDIDSKLEETTEKEIKLDNSDKEVLKYEMYID